MSNWNVDRDVASQHDINRALRPYTQSENLFDAYVTLYHDLYGYNAGRYVTAMRTLGYDGYIVKLDNGIQHLVLWNPDTMRIKEFAEDRSYGSAIAPSASRSSFPGCTTSR